MIENDSINISDYFANEAAMHRISRVYARLARFLDIDGVNYTPFLYYYFRHTIGSVFYYADHLLDGEPRFARKDWLLDAVRACMAGRPVPRRPTGGGVGFYLLWTYLFGKASRVVRIGMHPPEYLLLSSIRFWNPKTGANVEYGALPSSLPGPSAYAMHLPPNLDHAMRHSVALLFQRKAFMAESVVSLRLLRSASREAGSVRERWDENCRDQRFRRIFTYRSVDYFPIIDAVFRSVSRNALVYICLLRHLVKELTAELSPSTVLLLNEDSLFDQLFITEAKGYRTVALSHEVIYPGCVHSFVRDARLRSDRAARPTPDLKLVWNEYARRTLIESCNYDPAAVQAVGNPKFSSIAGGRDPVAIRRRLGIPSDVEVLLYISEKRAEAYPFVRDLAVTNPDAVVVYNARTTGDAERMRAALGKRTFKNLVILPPNTMIYDLLTMADVVIATVSTVITESMLLGKAIVLFDPGVRLPDMPHLGRKLFVSVRSAEEFRAERLKLADPAYRAKSVARYARFVKEHYAVPDPERRIAAALRRLHHHA